MSHVLEKIFIDLLTVQLSAWLTDSANIVGAFPPKGGGLKNEQGKNKQYFNENMWCVARISTKRLQTVFEWLAKSPF